MFLAVSHQLISNGGLSHTIWPHVQLHKNGGVSLEGCYLFHLFQSFSFISSPLWYSRKFLCTFTPAFTVIKHQTAFGSLAVTVGSWTHSLICNLKAEGRETANCCSWWRWLFHKLQHTHIPELHLFSVVPPRLMQLNHARQPHSMSFSIAQQGGTS